MFVKCTGKGAIGGPIVFSLRMARGLTAEEATAAIVRGFLDIDIKGLPEQLREEIRRATRISEDAERLF